MSQLPQLIRDGADVPAIGLLVPGQDTPVAAQGGPITFDPVTGRPYAPVVTTGGSARQGYVAAYGSNAAATSAATDYQFKWGSAGTTQVNHVMIQNNTGANIQWDLDVAATVASPILATGQTIFLDVQTTILHLFTGNSQNVNGSSANNICVRGWM